MPRKTFTYCFRLSALAVTLSSAFLFVAGCAPQPLERASLDNGGVTVDSGASVPEKPSKPKAHVTTPIVPIPIKNIEVSSNASRAGHITSSNRLWCSATGRQPVARGWKWDDGQGNETARWVKVYFDGVQTLNALKFDTEWGGKQIYLVFLGWQSADHGNNVPIRQPGSIGG